MDLAWIPSALFHMYETSPDDHQHDFRSCERFDIEHSQPLPIDQPSAHDPPDDKENQPPASTNTSSSTLGRFLCHTCHAWIAITTNSYRRTCAHPDYPTHHYHRTTVNHPHNDYVCCGCDAHVQWSAHDPVIASSVFDLLKATRPVVRTYAHSIQNPEACPTLASTLLTVRLYIKDLILKDSRRNINSLNPNFVERIGLDDGSKELFGLIGFKFTDGFFMAPEGDLDLDLLNMMYEELTAALLEIQTTTNQPLQINNSSCRLAEPIIVNDYLGGQDSAEQGSTSGAVGLDDDCGLLGITSRASDELVIWAYQQRVQEQPNRTTEWLDCLAHIARARATDALETQVAIERSRGLISTSDINQAYAHFGLEREMSIDDTLLIGLHQVKASDEPQQKSTHDERLRVLGQARNSNNIIHYLDHGYPLKPSEDSQASIAPSERSPVGLNNIGNTCYLNSLLQYYYSLIPFRDVVLQMDNYVENEDKEDWQPKKIGGIEVDQKEVHRAKKFVGLLRQLFLQLQETDKRAISPEFDLAYMALLNERDDSGLHETSDAKDGSASITTTLEESVSTLVDSKKGSDVDDMLASSSALPAPSTTIPKEEPNLIDLDPMEMDAPDQPTSGQVADRQPDVDERVLPQIPTTTLSTEQSLSEPLAESASSTAATNETAGLPSSSTAAVAVDDLKKKPEASTAQQSTLNNMMFGKQQDVTECMGNMMYLLEAALKPVETTKGMEQIRDMVRDLFYGKGKQILTYQDAQKTVKKNQEEEFSHVIIDAVKSKHLYDGLDEYFFADKLENYREGQEAVREVSVQSFPPVLQVLVQRVHFDRATADVYKSNAFINFDKEIYLDRYCDVHFDQLAPRREKVAAWRTQLAQCEQAIHDLTMNKEYPMPIPDMLETTANILKEHQDDQTMDREKYQNAMALLEQEIASTRQVIQENTTEADRLRECIQHEYDDMTEYAYVLHAVFIHQGQANYGHYWVYLLDHVKQQWWKFNDSVVTKVQETEIFKDTTGSTANPYFLVYIKKDRVDQLVPIAE
ncbi:cysteine proteinase [Hesseltinella vesiculosa]|uniref:ubiquitinyl hydrolase 1 n=1 Tax=Hesseltinella vesiculosa TaxID=101127 RepID=A0A1X2GI62_9FUNG|nr:cysteine proteinase [Hesseltinella vesiculosa]